VIHELRQQPVYRQRHDGEGPAAGAVVVQQ
jgi:hypothetical protein